MPRTPRHAAIGLVVLFCLAATVSAQEPVAKPDAALLKRIAELEKRVKELEARLSEMEEKSKPAELDYTQTDDDKKLVKAFEDKLQVKFEAHRLDDVLDFYRNVKRVDLYVDWGRLEDVGVEKDTEVTLDLKERSAAVSLKLTLEQAGGANPSEPLAYAVMHGMVIISTKKGLESIAKEKVKFKDENKK